MAQRFNEAAGEAAESVQLARELGYTNVATRSLTSLAYSSAIRGDDEETRRYAGEALDVSAAHGLAPTVGLSLYALAMLDLGRGRWAEALERLQILVDPGMRATRSSRSGHCPTRLKPQCAQDVWTQPRGTDSPRRGCGRSGSRLGSGLDRELPRPHDPRRRGDRALRGGAPVRHGRAAIRPRAHSTFSTESTSDDAIGAPQACSCVPPWKHSSASEQSLEELVRLVESTCASRVSSKKERRVCTQNDRRSRLATPRC